MHILSCRCGEVLVKAVNGVIKLRSKIVIFRDDGAFAICKGCGSELPAPIQLDKDDLLAKSRNPRLILRDILQDS